MKKEFIKPSYEMVYFNNDVISTSACSCDVGGIPLEGNTTCVGQDNPTCECKINYSPALGNCIPCETYSG